MSDVTKILGRIDAGDSLALQELMPLVYDELRQLAAQRMRRERFDHTLQATALVHDAYMRLVDSENESNWRSRAHFFAAASQAMRRILIEHARRKSSQKRGGDWNRIALKDCEDQQLGNLT
ncbi:ECF-type sigma factor, partial [Stieleria sp.]|uniref:ECF-type sigma factor n=1 Tax=Stieleria sp. TaxID=2795976 RepID=UPI0035661B73